jgi:GNAT superfamily N-acetyltransferase
MKDYKTQIIQDRAAYYQVDPAIFDQPGVSFRYPEGLKGERTCYSTRLFKRDFISLPEELRSYIKEGTTIADLQEMLPGFKQEGIFYNLLLGSEKIPEFALPEGYSLKAVDPSDHQTIEMLTKECSKEDIDDAEVYLDDPDKIIRMVFYKEKPVAYAGYRIWDSGFGDVGILVHKDHRKRGLGVAAVQAVTKSCIEEGDIPIYRVDDSNKGSKSIALKCGYEVQWETHIFEWEEN